DIKIFTWVLLNLTSTSGIYNTYIKPNTVENDLHNKSCIKNLTEKAINSVPSEPLSNTEKDKTSPQR
ncbi:MAG: hypothetical protein Q4A95_10455, partial [Enterococcus hirae]|nr:hypothetical protein [Enterococcus hirae]